MRSKLKKQEQTRKRSIRNWQILIGLGIFLIVTSILAANHRDELIEVRRAIKGEMIGNFALTDLNNDTVQLSDYAGKHVLINAWATWCPPCMAEMPLLEDYYQTHKENDFEILAINAGESRETAANFAHQSGISFRILLDAEAQTLTKLGVSGYPTSILVGPDGKVEHIHIGLFFPDDLENEITPLLTEE